MSKEIKGNQKLNAIPQLQNLHDTQTIAYELKSALLTRIKELFEHIELEVQEVELTVPEKSEFGDYATNIALKLSSQLKISPREAATQITTSFSHPFVEKTEIAGPGFINIYLKTDFYINNLNQILVEDTGYGSWKLGEGQVMVEFGQPNTHKALTVGHIKSGITGLSISRLMKNLGFDVIQSNYYGDIGMHVAKCTWAFLNKGDKPEDFENLPSIEKMKYIADCYIYGHKQFKESENAQAEIKDINRKIYSKEDEELNFIYLQLRMWSLEHQNEVFQKLGVLFERQYPESEIYKEAVELVENNTGKTFIENEGAVIFPGDQYNLQRWVFLTSEHLPTYSGKDLALAHKKFTEFPDLVFSIVTTAVEQNDYFKAVIKALELINNSFTTKYFHIGFGWLLNSNKKMSSRLGNTINGIDVLNETKEYTLKRISADKEYDQESSEKIAEIVGIAGLKFLILSQELHKDINYNPEQFLNPEGFSGPYVLYGYVRAKSILRQVELLGANTPNQNNVPVEMNEVELKLLKLLSQYPTVALEAGKNIAPHTVCHYLFDVTQTFNQFYRENKVLVDDENVRNFRMKLTKATAIVLQNGLNLLGIETLEQM